MDYEALPNKYKARLGVGESSKGPSFIEDEKKKTAKSEVARRTTEEYIQLFSTVRTKVLSIKDYANTDFVKILLEKRFYKKVELIANRLNTRPDTVINNTLLLTLKRLEDTTKQKIE